MSPKGMVSSRPVGTIAPKNCGRAQLAHSTNRNAARGRFHHSGATIDLCRFYGASRARRLLSPWFHEPEQPDGRSVATGALPGEATL
jgi:hypothetical protein